ncbi:MAG: SCO1664 family protein [Acidimicrobiia bacterium]|nr:SCO1664 family protein [Acidimicrobiia bacterium]
MTAVVGRFVAASNATLLAETEDGTRVVYKPVAGERPLWDFEAETLAWREILAFRVADAMNLEIVPETVMGDGPFGPGSLQRYVEADEEFDAVTLITNADGRLWPLAVFDIVVNNADRKVGHILSTPTGLVGVDHGLTFHPDDKLRTVLWPFAGKSAPSGVVESVAALGIELEGELGQEITTALGEEAFLALASRVRTFLDNPVHPQPPDDRPAIPWPPY